MVDETKSILPSNHLEELFLSKSCLKYQLVEPIGTEVHPCLELLIKVPSVGFTISTNPSSPSPPSLNIVEKAVEEAERELGQDCRLSSLCQCGGRHGARTRVYNGRR